ncbi:MAG: hypothetical protein HYR86_07445 [Candidatus Rokubacteria bacterium]|nr:hypothetical protein [Candidatus Rokubacteria bacterium]
MFVGHYSAAFAARAVDRDVPLWHLFVAVQLVDVAWAALVLLGIEKVRVVPGITRSNPLDLYYMPYTHSLVAAVLWSLAAAAGYRLVRGAAATRRAMAMVGAAVLSHWVLDLIVHRPDLPLYDDTAKVGLGLWNLPVAAFVLEVGLLGAGVVVWRLGGPPAGATRAAVVLTVILAVAHLVFLLGPPPPSTSAIALTALVIFGLFAWGAARVDRAAARPEG